MTGLPIVWIPGHLCGPWLYAEQLAQFGQQHPTVIADTFSDDDIGAMAERLLAASPDRFVVAGLSMGGMVAMQAMIRAPERIAGAILMSTDPYAARAKEISWRSELVRTVEKQGVAAYASAFVQKFFAHSHQVRGMLEEAVFDLAEQTPVEVVKRQARALDRREDVLSLLKGFAAPVEVIVGGADRICPPSLHPPIAAACVNAEFTELSDVGHLATLEAPAEVNERIADLLRRVSAVIL